MSEELKHSPAPWSYCHEDKEGCICGQIWSVPQDFHIATAHYKHEELGEISEEQMKLNARLIAKAPALLAENAELKKLVGELVDLIDKAPQRFLAAYNIDVQRLRSKVKTFI